MINSSSAINFFDAVKKSNNSTNDSNGANIMQEAQNKAANLENKSALTVALEDYTKIANKFHGENKINITQEEIDPSFLAGIFNSGGDNNVFRSQGAKDFLNDNSNIYRSTIYEIASNTDGGLKYAKEGDNIYASALNFAKADIALIEKSYQANDKGDKNGKIDLTETNHLNANEDTVRIMAQLDLDGDPKTISAEEYASYIVAMDGLMQFGELNNIDFCNSLPDGNLDTENIGLVKQLHIDKLHDIAQSLYDNNYAN